MPDPTQTLSVEITDAEIVALHAFVPDPPDSILGSALAKICVALRSQPEHQGDDYCVHSKAMLGCPGCLSRLKRQAAQSCQQSPAPVLEELAAEFDRWAEKYQRDRGTTKQAEKDHHASGKLPPGETYIATWNYYEGLAFAYELAAFSCREKAAALKGDPDAQ